MPSVKTAKRHERRPGPYDPDRRCSTCGCFLSRNNPLNMCAPCQGGDWHSEEELTELQAKRLSAGRLEESLAA
jgi:hypothetical protein